jgi:lauroyl/myristoyl acyltransferase
VIVMQGESNPRARELHDSVRERSGARVFHVGSHPLDALPLVRELKRGTLIAVQLDRPAPSGRGLPVELFGEPAELPEGPFRLAALARVPLIPLFAKRRGLFDYELEVRPALEIGGPTGATLPAAAQASADAIQDFIGSCPTQWFNF